jgi:hypothetical protein
MLSLRHGYPEITSTPAQLEPNLRHEFIDHTHLGTWNSNAPADPLDEHSFDDGHHSFGRLPYLNYLGMQHDSVQMPHFQCLSD